MLAKFYSELRELMLKYNIEEMRSLTKGARIFLDDGTLIVGDFDVKEVTNITKETLKRFR